MNNIIEIKVDGKVIATIDPDVLTIGDQIDLEEAKGAKEIANWLVTRAGADLKVIRAFPLAKLMEIAEGIGNAVTQALEIPNGTKND